MNEDAFDAWLATFFPVLLEMDSDQLAQVILMATQQHRLTLKAEAGKGGVL